MERSHIGTTKECYELFWTNNGSIISKNSYYAASNLLSHQPFKEDEHDKLVTADEVRTNSFVTFYYGILHTDTHALANQQRFTYVSSIGIPDVVYRIFEKRLPIRTNEHRKSNDFLLSVRTEMSYFTLCVSFTQFRSATLIIIIIVIIIKLFWEFFTALNSECLSQEFEWQQV